MPLSIPIIYGSVRTERQGIRAARYVVAALTALGHAPVLVDPLEVGLPLLDRMFKEYKPGEAPPAMQRLADLYRGADGFIIVSGEYNHGVPPALANLLDHFLEEYFWRPSGIVCYSAGGFGGVRAAMALRMMLGELGMPSIPSLLAVQGIGRAFDEEGHPLVEGFEGRAARFFSEFVWYAEALAAKRVGGVPS